MKDLLGKALYTYYFLDKNIKVYTKTSASLKEELNLSYWFRDFCDMPVLEKKALQMAYGTVLDVGSGVGSHTLYLQKQGFDVSALDISEKVIEVCKRRGVNQYILGDILEVSGQKFDTILMMMNGTGIFKSLDNIDDYLLHLKSLLNEKGQILIDSSDLIYLFETDENGNPLVSPETRYYGEVDFTIYYKEQKETFTWLYLAYPMLEQRCNALGLNCEKIADGLHYDYLARITKA